MDAGELYRGLDELAADLERGGWRVAKVAKLTRAARKGHRAARNLNMSPLVTCMAFLAELDGAAGRKPFSETTRPKEGRAAAAAPRAAEHVPGPEAPVRVWNGQGWMACRVAAAPYGPDGEIVWEMTGVGDPGRRLQGGLACVHPADQARAARQAQDAARLTSELGPEWTKYRGGSESDGAGSQEDAAG